MSPVLYQKLMNSPNGMRSLLYYVSELFSILDEGKGLPLSDIRDMINTEEDSSFFNHEVKRFLVEEFGDEIKICEPEQKSQSQFVFSSSVSVEDVVNSFRSLNAVKTTALEIRSTLLKVAFAIHKN